MVVLSVGTRSNPAAGKIFPQGALKLDPFRFVAQTDLQGSPSRASISGVFVAGTASAPMDIPDSILSAGAASSEAISYIIQHQEV